MSAPQHLLPRRPAWSILLHTTFISFSSYLTTKSSTSQQSPLKMWLLDTTTLELKEFIGSSIPPYAILSHTWGSTEDEVSFRDMRKNRDIAEAKKRFSKVKNCCLKAAKNHLEYAWIDSCCIDKRSSAELSEAINSVYKYYSRAIVCYVYLADVPSSTAGDIATVSMQDFKNSRWFTRGWTLQELIAPRKVLFFTSSWGIISGEMSFVHDGLKLGSNGFLRHLSFITMVPQVLLEDHTAINRFSSAQRMSWASRRQVTREEDAAYSCNYRFFTPARLISCAWDSNSGLNMRLNIDTSSHHENTY